MIAAILPPYDVQYEETLSTVVRLPGEEDQRQDRCQRGGQREACTLILPPDWTSLETSRTPP